MARRFGKFNKNQPRDRNGRWTSKGGGSRAKAKSSPSTKKTPTNKDYRSQIFGGAISAVASGAAGQPILAGIAATGAATAGYRLGSTVLAQRVNSSSRYSASQRDTFNRRKAAIDKQVGRLEKAQKVAAAGAFVAGFAMQAGNVYATGKFAENARLAKGPLQLARTALKAKRPGRGGVYNITSMSGRKVK